MMELEGSTGRRINWREGNRVLVLALLLASVIGHLTAPLDAMGILMTATAGALATAVWLAPARHATALLVDVFGLGVVVYHVSSLLGGWGGCGCFGDAAPVWWERFLVGAYLIAAGIHSHSCFKVSIK